MRVILSLSGTKKEFDAYLKAIKQISSMKNKR